MFKPNPPVEILAAYSLPAQHAQLVGVLAAALASAGESGRPAAGTPELAMARDLGQSLFALGRDEQEGHRYMRAALDAAKETHGADMAWLNLEWAGIGPWQA